MPARKSPSNRASDAKGDPELDLIRSLADILSETGLSEIELDRKGVRLRVAKNVTQVAAVHAPNHHISHATPMPAPIPTPMVEPAASAAEHPGTVKSPMVGTVYRAATPGTPPFVDVGSEVKEGQTLLIIEAMKTMNQIPAPKAGKVTHVFVDNGVPVEYGEPLVVIE